ncbi:hypothetical protein PVAP13_2KG315167 [Panicum virgatum]|uniref:Uncharacterized protein n=1 Tax=Panicum virgatum TaxID=38727 RepID=A0A8T0W9Q4_PANVG|nr:hypothetical protein PVAP13_2KG315167 [Panicum virgatum]
MMSSAAPTLLPPPAPSASSRGPAAGSLICLRRRPPHLPPPPLRELHPPRTGSAAAREQRRRGRELRHRAGQCGWQGRQMESQARGAADLGTEGELALEVRAGRSCTTSNRPPPQPIQPPLLLIQPPPPTSELRETSERSSELGPRGEARGGYRTAQAMYFCLPGDLEWLVR